MKDPGAKDTKKQGGGKKMADAEGKLGKQGKEDHTELPGEIRNGLGGVSDVLASETGDEIKHTLGTISSVAAALGGLNSNNIVLGMGTGTGLKGTGPGGGGIGPGVPFGSGTLNTGWGFGNGGGFGSGSGQVARVRAATAWVGRQRHRQREQHGERQVRGVERRRIGQRRALARTNSARRDGAPRALRVAESEAERNPNLKGGVTVAWQIAPEGNVTGRNLANSSLGNPRVEGCVVRQVKGWKFPSSWTLQRNLALQVRQRGRLGPHFSAVRPTWHGARSSKGCLTLPICLGA